MMMEEEGCFLCLGGRGKGKGKLLQHSSQDKPCILRSCDKCVAAVAFCSEEHRLLHQQSDQQQCYPYTVETRPNVGRCLVASQDLAAGSLVLREHPVMIGPLHDQSEPACLGCFRPCTVSTFTTQCAKLCSTFFVSQSRCHSCQLPLCTWPSTCTWRDLHLECRVLCETGIDWATQMDPETFYQSVLPLRCLLLRVVNFYPLSL